MRTDTALIARRHQSYHMAGALQVLHRPGPGKDSSFTDTKPVAQRGPHTEKASVTAVPQQQVTLALPGKPSTYTSCSKGHSLCLLSKRVAFAARACPSTTLLTLIHVWRAPRLPL